MLAGCQRAEPNNCFLFECKLVKLSGKTGRRWRGPKEDGFFLSSRALNGTWLGVCVTWQIDVYAHSHAS